MRLDVGRVRFERPKTISDNLIRVRRKLLRRRKGVYESFSSRRKKTQVNYTDNSLESSKSCEELSWNHRMSTPHPSETSGIAERAVRRVKEGTSAVLLQSGLDENWWADSMECFSYLRNIQDLLSDRKTPYERRFGESCKTTNYPVWFHWLSITYLCERPVKNPSIWKESLSWIVPRIRSVRLVNLEG